MNPTGIVFSLIAGADGTILSECSRSRQGTVALNAKKVFNSLPKAKADKRSYNYSGSCYNIAFEPSGTIYMAVTEENFSRVQAFGFLEELKKKFTAAGRPSGPAFTNELRKLMEFYSDPRNDKFAKLKTNIEEVKGVMIENIEKMIERGERIDRVVDKTDELAKASSTFQTRATTLKRKMWWKNVLLWGGIIVLILLLAFVIVLLACGKGGINFQRCFPTSGGHAVLPSNHTTAPHHSDSPTAFTDQPTPTPPGHGGSDSASHGGSPPTPNPGASGGDTPTPDSTGQPPTPASTDEPPTPAPTADGSSSFQ